MADAFLARWWRSEAKKDSAMRAKRKRKVAECKVCGQVKPIKARGMCMKCYDTWYKRQRREGKWQVKKERREQK